MLLFSLILFKRGCNLGRFGLTTCQNVSCHDVYTRYIHQWRVSAMYPGSAVLSGSDVEADGTVPGSEKGQAGSLSQKLMLQNNFIRGGGAVGTFNLLPFTMRAIEKLYRIIDHEMHKIGAQKISLPCLSASKPWKQSGRWDVMGSELITLEDRKGSSHCLAPTHEEAITSLVAAEGPVSYKRLPIMLYQIGRKFRDEMRPKNGLLRCREFEMKDLYTFDEDEQSGICNYEKVCAAYDSILNRLNLKYVKVEADTGAMGGSLSHEFQLLADVGEDVLYKCHECGKAFNQEIVEKGGELCQSKCRLGSPDLQVASGIEVAHAFLLGTKYSSQFKAMYTDKLRKKMPLYMGCFGIGVTRLIAAALEILSTTEQTRWPRLLAPHQVVIIPQKEGYNSDITWDISQELYASLDQIQNLSGEIVIDDRLSLSIGKRLKHAKQLGYPIAVVAGKRALENPPEFEVIDIYNSSSDYLSMEQLVERMSTVENIHLW